MSSLRTLLVVVAAVAFGGLLIAEPPAHQFAEIRVLDSNSGRGVPLVELETVNGQVFVTDNAGRVAFNEPGLIDREVFFTVRSHGYAVRKDGFGIAGVRLKPRVGQVAEIKLNRINIAERMCRLTGEGTYRDSELLGHTLPSVRSNGRVAGQDSVQAVIYNGRVFWIWGDTQRMEYPLGLFRTSGATTPLFDPKNPNSDPAAGIAFDYFVGKDGFSRAMMPLAERPEGVIWIFGLFVVPDKSGKEKLVGHYSRRKGLASELEHGIAVFDDDKQIFVIAKQLPLNETWRRPTGHPIPRSENGTKWILFGSPNPNVRVPATLEAVLDEKQAESYSATPQPDGSALWSWQRDKPPTDSKTEFAWLKLGKLKPEHARYCPADVSKLDSRIVLHNGSVRWNAYRKKWILIAGQSGGKPSYLGEVWYSEADTPTGPFAKAVKIATHDRQSFYNVCHHGFLDRDEGRLIHFEGTYTNEFSGNPWKTPRYNYNQVLYRLDLDAGRSHFDR